MTESGAMTIARLRSKQWLDADTRRDIQTVTALAQAILKRGWKRVKIGATFATAEIDPTRTIESLQGRCSMPGREVPGNSESPLLRRIQRGDENHDMVPLENHV